MYYEPKQTHTNITAAHLFEVKLLSEQLSHLPVASL